MLHTKTVFPNTLELLIKLQCLTELKDFVLVGGTALALHFGHRMSIDLDLFSYNVDIPVNIQNIASINKLKIENISLAKNIQIFNIDGIKVDFVCYPYPWLNSYIADKQMKIASLEDIAAMKISAIINRGTKKDFIDFYYLLEIFDLPQIMFFYKKKYPEASEFLAYKSLIYFEDAESDPMPKMFSKVKWEKIKKRILEISEKEIL